jgi:hypothetical protein
VFNEVYKIALQSNNFEELKRKLKKLNIDAVAFKEGYRITPAAQLAREGRNVKVEWMRQLGANVSFIAQGYARADNHERVEAYRTQHGARVSAIAQAYAIAGSHEHVEAYHAKHGAEVVAIAFGYALVNSHEHVETYRTQYSADVSEIAEGYAIENNHAYVETYRTQYGASVSAIAKGYAEAGNHERVEAYRTQHGASVTTIAEGYAQVDNNKKRKKYDINYLLGSYLTERKAVTDVSGITKEYLHGSFFSFFQKSFTQKKKAVQALKLALAGKDVDLSEHLPILRNGTLGKEIRAFVKSGMGDVLVGKEVNTISDFVQALQQNISLNALRY